MALHCSQSAATPMKENRGSVSANGHTNDTKHQTIVTTYSTASRTVMNINSNNVGDDNDIELQTTQHSDQPLHEGWILTSREWWMVGCFVVMTMMVTMDALIVIPILPEIAEKYHSSPSRDTTWPITVYTLANATLQRCYVSLMEIFGQKNILIGGLSMFTIGLILLSASPSLFLVLLVGRGIQGAGTAAMISIPSVMLMDLISGRRRTIYNFVIFFGGAIGAVLGLVLGGLFMREGSWKWIFYISLPFCFMLLLVTPFAVQPIGESLKSKKRLMNVDWTGMLLFSASMAALLLGLTWASSLQKQLKWEVLVALVAGAFGIMATMVYETSGASRPFLPVIVLKVSPVTFVCVLVQSLLISVQLVYIPAYLRGVHHLSSTSIGLILIAMLATMLLVNAGVDFVPTKIYHYRWPLWLGWALNIISSASTALFNTRTTLRVCVIVMIVMGLGHGITISATHMALHNLSRGVHPQRDTALIANFVRTAGFCLAIASADSAFHTRMSIHNRHHTAAQAYALSFQDLMRVLTALAGFEFMLFVMCAYTGGRILGINTWYLVLWMPDKKRAKLTKLVMYTAYTHQGCRRHTVRSTNKLAELLRYNFLPTVLAPFENPKVGAVETSKRALRIEKDFTTAAFWKMLGVMYLERQDFDVRAKKALDGGLFVNSGWTSAHRTSILQSPGFLNGYLNELLFFRLFGPLKCEDDNYIRRTFVDRNRAKAKVFSAAFTIPLFGTTTMIFLENFENRRQSFTKSLFPASTVGRIKVTSLK
ncbi:efflux pump antibiotic resistance protein, putative [Talaromyces stipitatus ATCC 10500]|uniref:Efflux pump antibiotic resistance protein, putative n=1 Tax=Talaromyces stipitatus (strain ATCC 10500 / CBS 375.48 / QM 6759 / NRRL 1006) TaxID=441959 RepID=B8MID5_TALSN|nr:efflux pump antibiotic resistance protein, putative [Talaromyces stipitatus ATCC 10500]EED14619.1 efflux pump antibiotic resistance protein, putative [Talaromyces stipitatus ATCC 10500]